MKRGISPLISWVLLVAMSIAIGSIVYMWAINLGHNIKVDQPRDIYCDNTHLKILKSCRDQSLLLMNLSNTGSYNITSITFYKESESTVPGSCILLLNQPLKPGTSMVYNVSVDANFSSEYLTECDPPIRSISSTLVNEFSAIPWVYQDYNNTDCPESKTILSQTETNELCYGIAISYDFSKIDDDVECDGVTPERLIIEVTNLGINSVDLTPVVFVYEGTGSIVPVSFLNLNPGATTTFNVTTYFNSNPLHWVNLTIGGRTISSGIFNCI